MIVSPSQIPFFDKTVTAMSMPHDDSLVWKVWVGSVVSVIAATVPVAARFFARKISAAPYWWDDWTILASLVSKALRSKEHSDFFVRRYNGAWVFRDGLSLWITIMATMTYMWEHIGSAYSKR